MCVNSQEYGTLEPEWELKDDLRNIASMQQLGDRKGNVLNKHGSVGETWEHQARGRAARQTGTKIVGRVCI